jgi:hypothetical protein
MTGLLPSVTWKRLGAELISLEENSSLPGTVNLRRFCNSGR